MNTIREIPLQNQQDFWTMLYAELGKSVLKICGRHGEAAIRNALGRVASYEGQMFLQACEKQGVKPNLHTLYAMGCGCSMDPRVRTSVLCDEEQQRLWETYTCPIANLLLDQNAADLAIMYCEENQLNLMKVFTDGKGQFHVTKRISCHRSNGTRPDNYCRFSAYYRAANTVKEKREELFNLGGTLENAISVETVHESVARRTVQYLSYLTEEVKVLFGNEGLSSVALGLRAIVLPTKDMMEHYALMTLNKDMDLFVKNNLPLLIDTEKDPVWTAFGTEEARSLYEKNFAGLLRKELNI